MLQIDDTPEMLAGETIGVRDAAFLDVLPVAAYLCDPNGLITRYNQRAAAFWGHAPALDGARRYCGAHRLHAPDGALLPPEASPVAAALAAGRALKDVEAEIEQPEGQRRRALFNIAILRTGEEIAGALVCLRPAPEPAPREGDSAALSLMETRQKLLLDELNHRVKNTLATVQSIATLSLRNAPSPSAFREAFSARLIALSRAHDLLTRAHWAEARLRDVIVQALEPHGVTEGERISIEGEDAPLSPAAALTLSLAFHELASNAALHGALSRKEGRLAVFWELGPDASGEGNNVALSWVERGGPRAAPPSHHGFGSRLLERSIKLELQGALSQEYGPDGLECRLWFPLTAGPPAIGTTLSDGSASPGRPSVQAFPPGTILS